METWIIVALWICGIAAAIIAFLYSAAPLAWRYLSKDIDATFKPEDLDPLAEPASGQETQGNPIVTVHENGSYSIAFGTGRVLDHGTLMVRVNGIEYWAHKPSKLASVEGIESEIESVPSRRLLLVSNQPAEDVVDVWGTARKYTMTWRVETEGESSDKSITLDSWIMSYKDKAVVRFGIKFNNTLLGTTTGKRPDPVFKFPCLTMHGPNRRVFTYRVQVFCPPMKNLAGNDRSTQGPVVFYDNKLNSVVLGPIDHFPLARTGRIPWAGETNMVFHGVEGRIREIPANYVHESLVLFTSGINRAVVEYGTLLRAIYKNPPRDPHVDLFTGMLGYWTDNGAYYYYRTEKGMNYADSLLYAKRVFDKKGIPFRYFQLDSWWYKKLPKYEWTRPPKKWFAPLVKGLAKGGTDVWDVVPVHFPAGLKAFREELGLPLAAHARWFAPGTGYKQFPEHYRFETSNFGALPIEERFWDDLMRRSKEMGIDHYEQDWITTMFNNIPLLQQDIAAGEHLLDWMGKAAEKHGLTIQYCMAPPGVFLQALKLPAVTNARTGGDYWARAPKEFFIPDITQANILCWAIGIWPSYDVFYSKKTSIFTSQFFYRERHPEFMALTSVLGGGLVCPGDKAERVDKALLMQTCDDEGVLLKPDRPLTPNDVMFKPNAKPYIMDTSTTVSGKTWRYIVPVVFHSKLTKDPTISLDELGYTREAGVLYDYISKTTQTIDSKTRIALPSTYMNWRHLVFAPWLVGDGQRLAMIGIENKFVMVPRHVMKAVEIAGREVRIELEYCVNRSITLLFYTVTSPTSIEINGETAPGCDHDAAASILRVPVTFSAGKNASVVIKP